MDIIRGLKASINQNDSIYEAIKKIDTLGIGFVGVIDNENKLIGVLTDADVRRSILKGVEKENSVQQIMNTDFICAKKGINQAGIENLMRDTNKTQIPVISENGELIDVLTKIDFTKPIIDNQVVIFAGGLGSRLRPLTNNYPKSMLKVGEKPILEIIIENLLRAGLHKIVIALNYKGEIIEEHFGNGENWGCQIFYLREKKKLGTAGALSLLKEKPELPFFVMNADLLTKVNFNHILEFHNQHNAMMTVCVREYDIDVPYGVIKTKDEYLVSIDEKPKHSFSVNAGIYLIDPDALNNVPSNAFFDMTDLIDIFIKKNMKTAVYPITDYWIDIGQYKDFDKAQKDYNQYFENL